jgi:hypothetical protein
MPDENHIQEDVLFIDISQNHEVAEWCVRFGCPPKMLRQAVKKIGSNARDVEKELRCAQTVDARRPE